ncbi:acyltransferase family protein [Glaciecola sp. 1036]|uniref:acyltransferase family protein n=1 Tax=Alteromonadaceae TaxID=72275 RepID=UPI003D079C44
MLKIAKLQPDGLTSVSLDYIRFFAALAVVCGHAVGRIFGPYAEVVNPSIAEKIFRVLFSGYSSPAVMVFFVLSGLFIGRSIINQVNRQGFSFKNYLSRRLVRLWLVLIPALILTYLIDMYGLTYWTSDGVYNANTLYGSINPENLSFSIFISNLFFTQTILTPTLGTNGALWSLANEFWYYVLFPLLFLPLVCKSAPHIKLIQLMTAVIIFYFVGLDISILFSIWLLGVGLLFLPYSVVNNKHYIWLLSISFIVFIAALLFVRLSGQMDSKLVERVVCGVSFALFCYALINSDKRIVPSSTNKKISHELAGFSYTLYLIHTPLLCLGRAVLINSDGYLTFSFTSLLLYFALIIAILVIAYAMAKLTEFQTHKIYKWLKI